MCRFLLVKSKNKIKPEKFLREFSSMCEKSRAPDGDWQGDGWGIALKSQISKLKSQSWDIYKSLKPVWKDQEQFNKFPETDLFVVHARSSGFPDQKGIIEYNQPYIEDSLCYVFNGMIRGVSLSKPIAGKIGAQKIFSLLKQQIQNNPPEEALENVDKLIINNAKKAEGMNIGFVYEDKFYVLCEYENNQDYFGVRYFRDDNITLVCSEPIGSYQWRYMKKSEILVL